MQSLARAQRPIERNTPHAASRAVPGPQHGRLMQHAESLNQPLRLERVARTPVVQRKINFRPGTDYLDDPSIPFPGYVATIDEAKAMSPTVSVNAKYVDDATARYVPDDIERKGEIDIEPISPAQIAEKKTAYHDNLIAMSHETRHAIDDLTKKHNLRSNDATGRIFSEWNAFATQSAVALQAPEGHYSDRFLTSIASFASTAAFTGGKGDMLRVTASYLVRYRMEKSYDEAAARRFMDANKPQVADAVELFKRLAPTRISADEAQYLRPQGMAQNDWARTLGLSGTAKMIIGVVLFAVVLAALFKHFSGK
jgi:hypothetical protein